jgi:hypothetical protein
VLDRWLRRNRLEVDRLSIDFIDNWANNDGDDKKDQHCAADQRQLVAQEAPPGIAPERARRCRKVLFELLNGRRWLNSW